MPQPASDNDLWRRLFAAAKAGAKSARNTQDPEAIANQVVEEMLQKPLPESPEAVARLAGFRRSVNAETSDQRRRSRELKAVVPSTSPGPEAKVVAALMVRELFLFARTECSAKDYEMLEALYAADGYTADAINFVAETTGHSKDLLRKRLTRAIERVRKYLDEMDDDDDADA